MIFYGKLRNMVIVTDDYDEKEIAEQLHLKYLKQDMIANNLHGKMKVYFGNGIHVADVEN